MQPDYPYRSEERTLATIEATRIIRAKADRIAEVCSVAQQGEIVLAVVNGSFGFEGVEVLPLVGLYARVTSLQPGSWHLVFSPGLSVEEIEERCDDTEKLATYKLQALRRWLSRQG